MLSCALWWAQTCLQWERGHGWLSVGWRREPSGEDPPSLAESGDQSLWASAQFPHLSNGDHQGTYPHGVILKIKWEGLWKIFGMVTRIIIIPSSKLCSTLTTVNNKQIRYKVILCVLCNGCILGINCSDLDVLYFFICICTQTRNLQSTKNTIIMNSR